MKEIEVRFKIRVGEWPETRLTKNNVIRKVASLGASILDDLDETIHDFKIIEDGEEKEVGEIPNTL